MRQVMRQLFIVICTVSLGSITADLSLLQPLPSASAQQVTRPAYQGNSGTGSQDRRIENLDTTLLYPTKSLEKKNSQSFTYKPHRLIRKPQNAPVATIEPSPSSFTAISSLPTPTQSLQANNTTSQSKEPSSFIRSVGPTVPLATVGLAPTSATTSGATAAGTGPTRTTPVAAAGTGNSSTSANGSASGRSMSNLAAETPGLAQLMSPPSGPAPATPPPSTNPVIGASPISLSFTATQGGANPANQTVTISNTGGGTLNWSATDAAPWLTLSPASGTGNGAVTLSATTGTLTANTYTTTVTLSGGSGVTPVTVPVTFTIAAAPVPPAIGASPTALSFTATQGGANPATQTLSISNPGGGTLTWSVADNQSWLATNTSTGTTTTETDTVSVSINTTNLTANTYSGVITVTATGASNTPQTIPVTLTLNPPTTSSATLTWNVNSESDLAGYKVYRATASGAYGAPIATLTGNIANYVATGLQIGTTYFFVVTAYDNAGNESMLSNEVSKSIF